MTLTMALLKNVQYCAIFSTSIIQ